MADLTVNLMCCDGCFEDSFNVKPSKVEFWNETQGPNSLGYTEVTMKVDVECPRCGRLNTITL